MMDEFELFAILIVLGILLAGWIIYQIVVGATYVLTAIFGVLYVIAALGGAVVLAGLDNLLCPPGIALPPVFAWAIWGAIAGGFLGFWTVAPVYKLRRARRLIMFAPLILAGAALALRLTVAPSPPLAIAETATAGPMAAVTLPPVTLDVPIRYFGSVATGREQSNRQLVFEASGRRYQLPLNAGHPAGGITVPLPPLPQLSGDPVQALSVLIEPRVASGAIGDTTYWQETNDHRAGLVASVRDASGRIYFTIVVPPDGIFRFVDGATFGASGPAPGTRIYNVALTSGLRGMGRVRAKITASFKFTKVTADESGWSMDSYGNYFPRYEFPEGTLTFTVQQPGT